MSVLSVLLYIVHDGALRRSWSRRIMNDDDEMLMVAFHRDIMARTRCPDQHLVMLEQSLDLDWKDVYDFVNPFGDCRGDAFNSVWTFDFDKDVLFLLKRDKLYSAPLLLFRDELLTLDDFELLSLPTQTIPEEQTLPGPYWDPELDLLPRQSTYLGRILRDFGYKWRHLYRRQMNTTTFMKLAYAIIWISRMEFTIRERVGLEHIDEGGPYVEVTDLPSWDAPASPLVQAGSTWFALAQNMQEGLEMVRRQMENPSSLGDSPTHVVTYAILTLRQVTLCKAHGSELVWTKSEMLFGNDPPSDTAINMILWASNIARVDPQRSKINSLPLEIQDQILYHTTSSPVASAKLGCELGLGPPFSWVDGGVKIRVEKVKRHRYETSPVESQITFNGMMSGLAYKRDIKAVAKPAITHHRPNTDTGSIILRNLNPPPAQTYLEARGVSVFLAKVERFPRSSTILYLRAMSGILRWLFGVAERYDVVRGEDRGSGKTDFVVLKLVRRPGDALYFHDFLMVECKNPEATWESADKNCARHCENTVNESEQVYAMVQVGMNIRFYQWGNSTLTALSDVLHLRNNVRDIIAWADWLKKNPLPFPFDPWS